MFDWLFNRGIRNDSGTANPAQWFVDWVRGASSDSGVNVNGQTAMSYAPIWNAVNKIAGHVGLMPLCVHEVVGERDKRLAKEHPAYRLLKKRPNHLMNASVFKELLQHHALLWGNGRAVIERGMHNEPLSLIPLPPTAYTVLMNGQKWHYYREKDTNREVVHRDRDVLHIIGLGFDGLQGYSLVEVAKDSIGLGLSAEKHMSRHFANNAVPSLVLEAPKGMFRDESAAKDFLANWNKFHKGLDQAGKTGLLREGMHANVLAMPGKDAQWLEHRRFQRQEAALWLLLESILGDDASVSYNSLEAKNLAYIANCVLRWLVKWQEEAEAKLLTVQEQEQESHFVKFVTAALLQGTTKERYEVYSLGRQMGVLSVNDVREKEDMPPIEGGDEYSNPAITPGDPTVDPPEEDEPEEATTDNIEQRVRAVMDLEARQVIEAAGRKGNFLKWLDKYYDTYAVALTGLYLELGGNVDDAADHITFSKESLIEVAGNSQAETLLANVRAAVETWDIRPSVIASYLRKEAVAA